MPSSFDTLYLEMGFHDEVYSLCINRVTLQYKILKKAQVAQLVERNFEGV